LRRILSLAVLPILFVTTTAVGQSRQLHSHEHGKGTLNMAIEGKIIAMEFEAPGADIVGFEHPAKNAADRAAIEKAKATLTQADQLFVLPNSAGCDLERAEVTLLSEEASDTKSENHTEFFAVYQFGCADPDQISEVRLPYFSAFPNAQELSIQLITRRGSTGYDANRTSPAVKIDSRS